MGYFKNKKIEAEECDWNELKHHGKPCPKHGYESDLTDEEQEDIKNAGGLDADKYKEPELENQLRTRRIETIYKNRINDVAENPSKYFKKSQLQRIHNYSLINGIAEDKFLLKVAFKIIVSGLEPEEAIERVYIETY